MKKALLIMSMAAVLAEVSCQASTFKKAVWAVAPYLKDKALFEAVENGDIRCVEKALASGANVNALDKKQGGSVLICAARNGHNKIVKMLVEAGANVNATVFVGLKVRFVTYFPGAERQAYKALHEAVKKRHYAIVKTLVESGADINAEIYGETALMIARGYGYTEIVKVLVEAGAVESIA